MGSIPMVSDVDYKRYVEKMDALIRDTLHEMECQPIFFVGSGLSKRYVDTPSWMELLNSIADYVGIDQSTFTYILQKRKNDPILVADDIEDIVFEWAWKHKSNIFPKEYFEKNFDKSIFMKFIICLNVENIYKNNISNLIDNDEIKLLRATNPHAIITTNYDRLLEEVFEGYEAVVGDKVIKYNLNLVGEIFKIHGSTLEPSSVVINTEDYKDYRIRKNTYLQNF